MLTNRRNPCIPTTLLFRSNRTRTNLKKRVHDRSAPRRPPSHVAQFTGASALKDLRSIPILWKSRLAPSMKAYKVGCPNWPPKKSCGIALEKSLRLSRRCDGDSQKIIQKSKVTCSTGRPGRPFQPAFGENSTRDSHQKVKIAYSDIAALAFTGRDTACRKELGGLGR